MAVQSHYNAALSSRPITWTRAFALELAYSYVVLPTNGHELTLSRSYRDQVLGSVGV